MKLDNNLYKLPAGFKACGFNGKIKQKKLDTAIITSSVPATAAGVFTKNMVRATCVDRNKIILDGQNKISAILANSGNANACTGMQGIEDNKTLATRISALLDVDPISILTASTGIIGVKLPMAGMLESIESSITLLSEHSGSYQDAARAIMTTDLTEKQVNVKVSIQNREITISGIAKGSGMIHPNMATMLGFILTDAEISHERLNTALKDVIDDTFNMISVDGDTSTNDMVLLLANGAAGNQQISKEDTDYVLFREALYEVCKYLAKSIVADGEGATKIIETEVNGCACKEDARLLAKSVIGSSLVKTAIFGSDPNWGRILAALGYAGPYFDPGKVSIFFQAGLMSVCLMKNGEPEKFDIHTAADILSKKEIFIRVQMGEGKFSAAAWGCDLSYDYVKINADYHT